MSSSSDSDDETRNDRPQFVSAAPIGQPYSRYQGSYLFNLQKLLNDGETLGMHRVMRWHPKISNALEINWQTFAQEFATVHKVLVKYKLSRGSNRFECVRPTMNRKLREWNFHMVTLPSQWVTYIYESDAFNRYASHGMLPTHRRRRNDKTQS